MAIEIVNAVMDRGPRSSKSVRLVFLAIARAADEYGFAYPKVETLSHAAMCDERTVRRAIEQLNREGWLAVRHKTAGAGRPSVYFVNLAKLAIGQHPGGSCRPLPRQKPKQQMHLELERAGQVRFASGAKPPTGERDVQAGLASAVKLPAIGEQDVQAGLASAVKLPAIGEQDLQNPMGCVNPKYEKNRPDILDSSDRTFLPVRPDILDAPLSIKRFKSEENSNPIPLPLSPAVDGEEKQVQVQVLPDERKSEEQATAGATAKAGRGKVVRMEPEQRRERREARRWEVISREGTETGVPAAAGRVMRACAFTDPRLLRVIVTAMQAYLAANRSAEVGWVEEKMIRRWDLAREESELMRFVMSPKYLFSDGRWADTRMWPYDQELLNRRRQARIGSV